MTNILIIMKTQKTYLLSKAKVNLVENNETIKYQLMSTNG